MGIDDSEAPGLAHTTTAHALALIEVLAREASTLQSVLTLAAGTLRARAAASDVVTREEIFRAVEDQSASIQSLTARLRELQALEIDDLALDVGPIESLDIHELLWAVSDELATLPGREPVVVIAPEARVLVMANRAATRQILIQLLHAANLNRAGYPVTVTLGRRDPFIEIGVGDRGEGALDGHLVERFISFEPDRETGDPMLPPSLRLGLGLARAQGGTLTRRSPDSGSGDIFLLSLPQSDADD